METSVGGAYSPERCQDQMGHQYEVVAPTNFFPIPWLESARFNDKKSMADWENIFKDAYSVDFYRSSMGNNRKILPPRYYGAKKPPYSYLGPKYCPLSFFADRSF